MYFRNLKFYNYRNIENTEIQLSSVLNVFIGKNAQGKTNILEAIYLLLSGKTFRPSKNIHIINKDAHIDFAAIGADLYESNVNRKIELQIKNNTKQLLLDNKRISTSKLQKHFPVILFSPESLSSIKAGPDERRTLIDDWIILFHKSGSEVLAEYSKALKTRNKLLRDYKSEKIFLDEFEKIFDSLNLSFYQAAYNLTTLRIKAILEIHKLFNKAMQRISNSKLDSEIRYIVSDKDVTDISEEELKKWLKERANDLRFAEISSGSSLFGPHKHDIVIRYDGNDSRYFCSQGQQRALILSFKIAQIVYYNARYGVFPLLLLDDVLSELDEEKRSFLVAFLRENSAQTFISSTELDLKVLEREHEMKVFNVVAGDIQLDETASQTKHRNGEQLL